MSNDDFFYGVFENERFREQIDEMNPEPERLEAFMRAITWILSRNPLEGQVTDQPGILALPSRGEDYGMQPLVVYYSFGDTDVTLEEIVKSN